MGPVPRTPGRTGTGWSFGQSTRGARSERAFSSSLRISSSFFETLFGHPGDHAHQLVAAPVSVEPRNALALEPQDLVRWCARGDPQQHLALQRGHLELGPQGELGVGQGDVDQHVVVVAHETTVLFLFDHHVEVTVTATAPGCVAVSAYGDVVAAHHAGRNLDLHRLRPANGTGAVAVVAAVPDDGALAVARAALHHVDKLSQDGALDLLDLPGARTRLAGGRCRAVLCAAAVAGVAVHQPRYPDLLLDAPGNFLQGQVHTHLQIPALAGACGAATGRAAEAALEAAELAHERAQRVGEIEALETPAESAPERAARTRTTAHARMAHLIVDAAALFVAEDLVGLGGLLELVLRLFVAGVLVGVVLECELAVRLLDLVLARPALDAQNLVVVSLAHRGGI